jgi:hypothetical protein
MVNQPYPPEPNGPIYLPAQQPVPGSNNADTMQMVNPGGASSSGQSANYVDSAGNQAESQSANYVDPAGNQVESRVEVYHDRTQQMANLRYWTTTGIYFILGVVEVVLGLRFIFRLFGASQGNNFIVFLYNLSHVFVGPFNGIFNDQTIGTRSVFELSTIIAMLIYALIAWGLVSLCRVIFTPTYSGERKTFSRRSI